MLRASARPYSSIISATRRGCISFLWEHCAQVTLQKLKQSGAFGVHAPQLRLDPDRFVPGLDLKRMYQDMYWASEGFI